MAPQDRRSGDERREMNRYAVEIDAEWEGSAGRTHATISDVSLDGCFVLSAGDVTDGEMIKLFVPLADGMKVQFDAKIANHVFEIGFGVRFEPLSAPQRELLIKLVHQAEGS